MTSRPYHHGDLRATLIRAAAQALQDVAPQDLSLRDLARRAGVSHGAPYAHFRNRDALLQALSEHGFSELHAEMHRALDASPDGTAAQLQQVTLAYLRFAWRAPHLLALMFSGAGGPPPPPDSLATFDLLVRVVRGAQAHGTLAPGDARRVATTLWGAAHGLATLALARRIPHSPDPARAAEAALRDLIEQYAAAGAPG